MKLAICIFHPAHVHNFRNIIRLANQRGHETIVLASNKDNSFKLLEQYNIPYTKLSESTGKNFFEKVFLFFFVTYKILKESKKNSVNAILDRALPVTALASFLLGIPHYIFDDTEITPIAWRINKIFSKKIITPSFFLLNLGKKHIKINTYKELFYLNPEYFIPNPQKLNSLNLNFDSKYSLIRFVSWDATHDVGHSGLNDTEKRELISELEKYGKVFISSEKKLGSEFEKYRLSIPIEDIHHILYYATIFIGEGGTMNNEAAILGTHTINLCEMKLGAHEELSNKYEIMYSYRDRKDRLEKSIERVRILFQTKDIWKLGKEKQQRILKENVNGSVWLLDFLEGELVNFS